MPGEDDIRIRLLRLEEAQAFADHAADQLNDEVRALGRRVLELQAQVRRLEAMLARLAAPADDPDSAPGDSDKQ